jgi:hypothetical protein
VPVTTQTIRDVYLAAAATVAPLLREPAVGAAWDQPSALEAFTVRGLAGHLASQVLMIERALGDAEPDLSVIGLPEHYSRVTWIGAPIDSDVNTLIRSSGEHAASEGAAALADEVDAAVDRQRAALLESPSRRLVTAPSGQWALSLDDFALTRGMEIAVHSDDLAVSVGIDAPALPDEVLMPMITLLTGLSIRRHGQAAVLRALSRRERAPSSIAAF